MNAVLKNYLFTKKIFVSESEIVDKNECLPTLISLANLFAIRITDGLEIVTKDMIKTASEQLGINVPEPFYRGFPESVTKLTNDQLLLDQVIHYVMTYGLGNFDEAGHSLFEDAFERLAFTEDAEIKNYVVLTESDAIDALESYVDGMLKSSRPLNEAQYAVVRAFLEEYAFGRGYKIKECPCKDTVVRLLYETKDVNYAKLMQLPDVIKLVDYINFRYYGNENITALNFKNQDRKFVEKVINYLFAQKSVNQRDCFEKKAVWCGLLHHIHFNPVNKAAERFAKKIRADKCNLSVYSLFEKYMADHNIKEAVAYLKREKGNGAVARNMNYLLSRCSSEDDVQCVISALDTPNLTIIVQMLIQYMNYREEGTRIFKFVRHNSMSVHVEKEEEAKRRKSALSSEVREMVTEKLKNLMNEILKEKKIGKVYVSESMKKIALPLQDATSTVGVGILPRGTRLAIPEGKKVRAFTYWERVHDIDLSCFGVDKNGQRTEYSWRTMAFRTGALLDDGTDLVFSGDETSGYHGGSEYFDVDIDKMKVNNPDMRYLVFCNNVFTSGVTFDRCFCKAGFMLRDKLDSGEVFEPKTVKSSFAVTGNNTYNIMFAIDLVTKEFVWLNISMNSMESVAGNSEMDFINEYINILSVINVYDLFTKMATEIVDDPKEADVIVTDEELEDVNESKEVIRSCDYEKIKAYIG